MIGLALRNRACKTRLMSEQAIPDPDENGGGKCPRPKKNEHAAALGRLGGLKGGKARAAAMTPEERKEGAKKAALARWGNIPKATHVGVVDIAGMKFPCAVLDDASRTRVLSQRGFYAAIGAKTVGGRKDADGEEAEIGDAASDAGNLPPFLAAKNLKEFISDELAMTLRRPIVYRNVGTGRARGGGTVSYGIPATVIADICDVWLKARDKGALHHKQEHLANKAYLLMRSLAKVALVSLVDRATGYQADKDREDLTRLLKAYVAEELQPWLPRFPHEFFKQIHRLWGWVYTENKTQGPRYVGKLINKYIYGRLPPGVLEELQRKNPSINGRRRDAHHQHLTDHTGIPHLDKLVTSVTTLLFISDNKADFESHLKKRFPKKGDQGDLPFPRALPRGESPRDEEE